MEQANLAPESFHVPMAEPVVGTRFGNGTIQSVFLLVAGPPQEMLPPVEKFINFLGPCPSPIFVRGRAS